MAYNTTIGSDFFMGMVGSVNTAVPLFMDSLLFAIFTIISLGGYFSIKVQTGRSRIILTLAASSFITTILATFLMMAGFVTTYIVSFFAVLAIMMFIALIFYNN